MRALVIMPRIEEFDKVREVIVKACEDRQIKPVELGQLNAVDDMRRLVDKEVKNCDLVIVDFTGEKFPAFANPKIVAQARYIGNIDKPMLIITQSAEVLPLDWKDKRAIVYEKTSLGLDYLYEVLGGDLEVVKQRATPNGVQQRLLQSSQSKKTYATRKLAQGDKIEVRKIEDPFAIVMSSDYSNIKQKSCYSPRISPDNSFAVFQNENDHEQNWIYNHLKKQIASFKTPEPCNKPLISPDSNFIIFCNESDNGKVWVYDKKGNLITSYRTPEACYRPIISPDSNYVVFQDKNLERQLWLYQKQGKQIATFITPNGCYQPTISPDSELIVLQAKSNNTQVWFYSREGKQLASFITEEPCYPPEIDLEGTCFIFHSEISEKVWFTNRKGEQITGFATAEPCYRPRFSPDGRHVLFQSKEDNKKVWCYDNYGRVTGAFQVPEPCYPPKISSDATCAIFVGEGNSGKIWVYDFRKKMVMTDRHYKFNQQIIDDGFGRFIRLDEFNALMNLAEELGFLELSKSDFEVIDNLVTKIHLSGLTPEICQKYQSAFEIAEL